MSNRLLHTMIRVMDLDKSIDFYTRHLGMRLLRRKDYPSGEFTLAFVGYGDEDDNSVIELTHNWGRKEPYEIGTAFGHLAVGDHASDGRPRCIPGSGVRHADRRCSDYADSERSVCDLHLQ